MTKRPGTPTYRWLNMSLVIAGVTVSLVGARLLQWQAEDVAAAASSSAQPSTGYTIIELPPPLDLQVDLQGDRLQIDPQNRDAVVVELAPMPTLAAPSSVPQPRPVARTRSSR